MIRSAYLIKDVYYLVAFRPHRRKIGFYRLAIDNSGAGAFEPIWWAECSIGGKVVYPITAITIGGAGLYTGNQHLCGNLIGLFRSEQAAIRAINSECLEVRDKRFRRATARNLKSLDQALRKGIIVQYVEDDDGW